MPRRGELISHAGRVNTAIHQVQEENNRAEALRDTSPSTLSLPRPTPSPSPTIAKSPSSLWPHSCSERTQEQIQDKREEINFLAKKCSDDVGHIRVIYTHWTQGEMKTEARRRAG